MEHKDLSKITYFMNSIPMNRLMPGAIPIPKGTKMAGQSHPLLFEEPLKQRL